MFTPSSYGTFLDLSQYPEGQPGALKSAQYTEMTTLPSSLDESSSAPPPQAEEASSSVYIPVAGNDEDVLIEPSDQLEELQPSMIIPANGNNAPSHPPTPAVDVVNLSSVVGSFNTSAQTSTQLPDPDRPVSILKAKRSGNLIFSSLGATRWFVSAPAASHRRYYRRLIFRNGERNFSLTNIPKRSRRYLTDIFTTLINVKWRVLLTIFVLSFVVLWLLFAGVWCLLLTVHGDFRPDKEPDWKPCVANVDDFASALLFSIETQHTIGYGYRFPYTNCPEAITLVMIQACIGVVLQALMAGLVFAKLARPRMRAQTLLFSKRAVICKRDGILTLLFRVGDMRKSHILDTHIRGMLIKKRVTLEGEVLPMEEHPVDFGYNEGRDRLYLAWPTTVEHRITDATSPFWRMSSQDLQEHHFELIIILEGIVESTGMTTHARCSYLPNEILWGHRLKPLFTFQKDNGQYVIDFDRFHAVEEINDFPQTSAMEQYAADVEARRNRHEEGDDAEGDEEGVSSWTLPSTSRNSSLRGTPNSRNIVRRWKHSRRVS